MEMEIGGIQYHLDPAAISAIRYRAAYGNSVINHLTECKTRHEETVCLLRMCFQMIPPTERPTIEEFTKRVRADGLFIRKAYQARDALLSLDALYEWKSNTEPDSEPFDEYSILALIWAIGIDTDLVYTLPIMHLVAVAARSLEQQDPDYARPHKLTDDEMMNLFPRRS